jgi:hypothetical protein
MKQIRKRVVAKTPPFFQQLRNGALLVTGIATALLTAPISLPALVTTIAGYLVTAGSVATVISQLTTLQEVPTAPGNSLSPKMSGDESPGAGQ